MSQNQHQQCCIYPPLFHHQLVSERTSPQIHVALPFLLLGHSVWGHMHSATAGKKRKERQKERKNIRDRRVEATQLQSAALIFTEAVAIDQCELPCTAFCWKQSFWSSALQPESTWAHTSSFCSTHHMMLLGFTVMSMSTRSWWHIKVQHEGHTLHSITILLSVFRMCDGLNRQQIHLHWGWISDSELSVLHDTALVGNVRCDQTNAKSSSVKWDRRYGYYRMFRFKKVGAFTCSIIMKNIL